MESGLDEKESTRESLLERQKRKGGLRTMPFIIANESFEKVASFGLAPNMIKYLMNDYHMDMATGSNVLFLWNAANNLTPVFGAFIADSYVGRFRMIGLGSIVSFLGMVLLWSTTVVPQARPPPCDQSTYTCLPPSALQLTLLCCSFGLLSLGAGGIRSSSLAFGADQLDTKYGLKNARAMESYFGWYYFWATFSVLLAMSCIVYIQDNSGWAFGFGVPAMLMFLATLSFFLASPFYVKLMANSGLIRGLVQVVVASVRNRHISLSSQGEDVLYHSKRGSMLQLPSEKLRFLNKACIIQDPLHDLTPDGMASNPWTLCTVDQVEELKALIKIIPLWTTGIMVSVSISQPSFPLLQATSMDRHVTPNFEIPAASFGMFVVISAMLWIVLYDRVILPVASKIMKKPVYLSAKQRMGIGCLLSFIAMAVTAVVEGIRRTNAIEVAHNNSEMRTAMSALWLVPQYWLCGLAEASNAVAQNEFYFSELPRSMSSVAANLIGVSMGAASLLAGFILSTIDDVTGSGERESWISSDINKGHYDYYFWILSGLSLVNFMYFLACSKAYGPGVGEGQRAWDAGEEEIREE
ncbi:hypothetical protein NMG60_11000836 [Bertholletia excelsa]